MHTRADSKSQDAASQETNDVNVRNERAGAARRPRGFLLVVVAALAALAGVMAMGQWSIATSAVRTGINVSTDARARAIANACLEQYLRYAKDGVDRNGWTDFDRLLDFNNSAAPDADDFIPPAAQCTLGVAYVPSSMSAAAEPRQGLHRYCAVRMDQGACFLRFDDNSDDGKTGPLVTAATGPLEGTAAAGGDNPRRDTDYSVLVTAIGLYPAKTTTPLAQLYERAESRATKRALLQIELEAVTAISALHADTVNFRSGPGAGNYAARICGAGGISTGDLTGSFEANDGCTCGQHVIGTGEVLDSSCGCGSDLCAPAPSAPSTAYVAPDDDATPDNTPPVAEYDQDLPPPVLPNPNLWTGAARGNMFATSVLGKVTENQPMVLPTTGGNAQCMFYFGGKRVVAGTTEPGGITENGAYPASPNEVRAVWVWDHSDTDAVATLTAKTAALGALSPAKTLTLTGTAPTYAVDCSQYPTTIPVGNPATINSPDLPKPCAWNFVTASDDVTGVEVDLATCSVGHYGLCWRPVALMDGTGDKKFLGENSDDKETTKDNSGVEAFMPINNHKVTLVRAANAAAVSATPTWQNFCGPGASSNDDEGPSWEKANGRWLVDPDSDITQSRWSSRGVYWIFDYEHMDNQSSLVINEKLGTSSTNRLRVGIISRGPVKLLDELNVYCPSCSSTATTPMDPSVLDTRATGYFLYAGGPCMFTDHIRSLTGDIMCLAAAIVHSSGGNHPERVYSSIYSNGNCNGFNCDTRTPSTASFPVIDLGTFRDNMSPASGTSFETHCADPIWTLAANVDDMGICIDRHVARDEDDVWVGRLWSNTDVVLWEENFIAAPAPVFPAPFPGNHPELPVIFARDDILVWQANEIWGKIQTTRSSGHELLWIYDQNIIHGRVVGHDVNFGASLLPSSGRNRIVWDGAGITAAAIADNVSYLDLGW